MDIVVDGHFILSQEIFHEKFQVRNRGEGTPRIASEQSVHPQPPSYRCRIAVERINAWNQTAKLFSRNIAATTTRGRALERNDPVKANSFASQRVNFSSSPLMVQLFFFERSH
jgi:hypothetical protein